MLSTERINAHSWWISVFEPLPHERQDLIQKYEVTKELLDYAIDPMKKLGLKSIQMLELLY